MTSTEQQALRQEARRLLADRSSTERVRQVIESGTGHDPDLWKELASIGWAGIAVPEAAGGTGLGLGEAAVLFEEAGRALLCAPLLGTTLTSVALLEGGSGEQQQAWLPEICAGSLTGTVVIPSEPSADPAIEWRDGRLHGTAPVVIDGDSADLLVVAARDGERHVVCVVPRDAPGVTCERLEAMDQTRPVAAVSFEGTVVTDTGRLDGGREFVDRLRMTGAILLASEQVGVAGRALEQATDYAKTRIQFGRAIGSFQAIKHRLAEILVDLEAARSVASHAAAALARDDRAELPIAAAMARTVCTDVAIRATGDNIQVHGGIGFTWEHDAHFAFKRASSTKYLFGSPKAWRSLLADAIGLEPAV